MPYIIALVNIVIAAGALHLFRQPAEAPAEPVAEEVAQEQEEQTAGLPEGFIPPTEQPPSLDTETESMLEGDPALEESTTSEDTPEAVAESSETYVAEASYFTPRRTEHEMQITFELAGETVTDVNVNYDGGAAATPSHSSFDAAYKTEVIGQNINTIELSRVGGASLTSTAFNEAVADVRAQL